MYKYFAGAALAAVMATGAAASTMTMNDYKDGFYWGASPEQQFTNGVFGPSSVITTLTFTRGGGDFFFESLTVQNSDKNLDGAAPTGQYSFTGFNDTHEIYGSGLVTVPAPSSPTTVLSGQDGVAIDKLEITISAGRTQLVEGTGPVVVGVAISDVELSAVPVPASVLLLGAGLAGLGAMRRRQKKA